MWWTLLWACQPSGALLSAQLAPPPYDLTLTATEGLVVGQPASFVVSGASPGARVFLAVSPSGIGGPLCPAALGGSCVDIEAPSTVLGPRVAGADGVAAFPVTIPNVPPMYVAFQAAVLRPGLPAEISPRLGRWLHPAGTTLVDGVDLDGDGFPWGEGDCNDSAVAVHPGASELLDGRDHDCDGEDGAAQGVPGDQDGDGFAALAFGGADCDDQQPVVFPGAAEIWYDGVDQDRDPATEWDQDGDGDPATPVGADCADLDDQRSSLAAERCDGLDQDCDGVVDEGVPSDGNGCQDPSPPPTVQVGSRLHLTVRTSAAANAGSDTIEAEVCLSANTCFDLGLDNWNDFEEGRTDQDNTGTATAPEAGDLFGGSLVAADFNGDGRADLAVGHPGEAIGAVAVAGMVTVVWGDLSGLGQAGDQTFHQDTAGIPGDVEAGDALSSALGAGDFDGDGYAELVVGVADEAIGPLAEAGYVITIPGSGAGLVLASAQSWFLDQPGFSTAAAAGDRFGGAFAAGDVNADGWVDLAIGAPGRSVGGDDGAGALWLLWGAPGGLTTAGVQTLSQDDLPDVGAEAGDAFASALQIADHDGDGYADLAIGAPQEAIEAVSGAGMAHTVPGGPAGLVSSSARRWHADLAAMLDDAEVGDRLGAALP